MQDALSLLALQIAWGADEALLPEPVSRLHARPAEPPAARPVRPPSPDLVHAPLVARTAAPAPVPLPTQPIAETLIVQTTVAQTAVVQTPVADANDTVRPVRPGVPARGPAADARAIADNAADLDALRTAIAGFDNCSLRDTATRSVLPTGTLASRIAIVGEVPDEDEDRAGHPFAGRAGDLLDRMLGSVGLDRDGVLLLPLIPWRPPGGRAPSPIEMATCLPFLDRALMLAGPAFILCMGSRPSRVVADSVIRAGAGWRKPVLPGLPDETRALPMRHPSYLLSHLPARKDAWTDLLRLRRALDSGNGSITAA